MDMTGKVKKPIPIIELISKRKTVVICSDGYFCKKMANEANFEGGKVTLESRRSCDFFFVENAGGAERFQGNVL